MFVPKYVTAQETFHLYQQALRQADLRRFDAHINALLHAENAASLQEHEAALARIEADMQEFVAPFLQPISDPAPPEADAPTTDASPTTEPHEETPEWQPLPLSPASTGESDLSIP